MNNYKKRIKQDVKQIKRAFMTVLLVNVLSALFMLGVAGWIVYATLKYFGILG